VGASQVSGADTVSYTYDSWNRLKTAISSSSTDYAYGYDPDSNLSSKTVGSAQTTYTYNAASELTGAGSTSYGYDGNGSLSTVNGTTYAAYNAMDQTISISPAGGSSTTFSYAGATQDERTARGSTTFVNHLLGVGSEKTGTTTTYYRWSDESTEPFALTSERIGASGPRYYYLFDGLGSVVGVVDASGNVVDTYAYEPYGKITSSTGTVANPWRFAGAYFDTQTGLYHMGARYYDPNLQRWTQQDPKSGHLMTPLSLNRYLYADDDPLNRMDPIGTNSCGLGSLLVDIWGFWTVTLFALGGATFGVTTAVAATFLVASALIYFLCD
jgi:RHS repeat-associated protein